MPGHGHVPQYHIPPNAMEYMGSEVYPRQIYYANEGSSTSMAPRPLQECYESRERQQQPPLEFEFDENPALTYFAHEQQRSLANSRNTKKVGSKKPCNCSKSQCLKLYCECFAAGELCVDCNCKDCHNNMEFESDRTRAVKTTLDRNPNAFRPKIGIEKKGQTDLETAS
ncbi:hypothetical protein L596_009752 [Steinernema carpocapsae]|uniref:CRC domain-containing protein n=1 Tax=Steinernema carpocapsae TaxID=34508 RepID=A0A4U5PG85_STECR|nr:hypothetical protein L596_009752 [Steinernema carpocapsae]